MQRKKKKGLRNFIIITLIVGAICLLVLNFNNIRNFIFPKYNELNKVEATYYDINEYYIYGQYLTIKGTLNNFTNSSATKISLVLDNKLKKGEDLYLDTDYSVKDSVLTFSTKGKLNTGQYLDDLAIGDYYLFLQVDTQDESIYYTGTNKTTYPKLDYYTLTKNSKNNYLLIEGGNQDLIPYISFNIIEKALPSNVYDILLDPGHGGGDPGNTVQTIREKEQVLELSLEMKNQLEALGYKVLLSRDGDYNPGHLEFVKPNGLVSYSNPYGYGGRIAMSYESKAKYTFAIHTNSLYPNKTVNGLEIYAPGDIDYTLAKSLATNIVNLSGLKYSSYNLHKIANGIYVRYYTDNNIKEATDDAIAANFTPYPVTTSTLYNYTLRETSGYMMGAYVDGRNPYYDENPYRNANYGTETYLLEMGYSSNNSDYNNIINNKVKVAEGFVTGFDSYIKTK